MTPDIPTIARKLTASAMSFSAPIAYTLFAYPIVLRTWARIDARHHYVARPVAVNTP